MAYGLLSGIVAHDFGYLAFQVRLAGCFPGRILSWLHCLLAAPPNAVKGKSEQVPGTKLEESWQTTSFFSFFLGGLPRLDSRVHDLNLSHSKIPTRFRSSTIQSTINNLNDPKPKTLNQQTLPSPAQHLGLTLHINVSLVVSATQIQTLRPKPGAHSMNP